MKNESNVRSVSTSESDSLVQKHENVCPLEKVYPSSSGNTTEYKKCNTLKYLISATTDGIINYVSPGYSERITDTTLVEECGYLKMLPKGVQVMADRGFKHIEPLLLSRGTLVRPPSTEQKKKSSKGQVLETKRIASLRIHIERAIRRIREFKLLKPYSCINNKLIYLTDEVVVIAAGLINLQGPLIKQS
jgi:hypothetical protein